MQRKIVFVKVESSVIEISESVHWSRRRYAISLFKRRKWNFIGIPRNGQPNDILSTYALQKTCASHWRGTVVLESKENICTRVLSWKYSMGTRSGACK